MTAMRTMWGQLKGVFSKPPAATGGGTTPPTAPSPEAEKQNTDKNVTEGTTKFGSAGGQFKKLKGSGNLNTRQKQIFNENLKKAIEADPRAKAGAMSDADLKALAQQAADVTNKLAEVPFGKDVNKLAAKSETLKTNIVELQNDGWTIKYAEDGKGDRTDRKDKIITIDKSEHAGTKAFVESLAHETGHGRSPKPVIPTVADDSPTVEKGRAYIRGVVEAFLLDEGEAQVVACETAAELEAKGEKKINIPGTHSDQYKAVYKKLADGSLSRADARKEMAKIMGTESTTGGNQNYVTYYGDWARQQWNDAHADAPVPDTDPITVFP